MPKLLPIVALLLSAIAALAPHTLTASPSRLPDDPLLRTQMPFLETEVSTASRLPNEAAPQIRLPASKVTFQSYRDDTWNLFMANDDTSNEIALTSDESRNLQPRLNRGGGRVVFTSARDGDFEIYSMGSDGTAVTQLTSHNEDDVFPVWSPDSSKIAFQSYRDGQPEVYVMNANGSGVTRLTDNPAYDGYPSWSPDGSKIAFMSSRPGGFRIHVMNADGSNVNQLSNQPSSIFPSWSPDGRYIAYSSDNDGDGWLETSVMNADGTDQHTVYDPYGSRDAWTSDWSPDGRYIAFTEIDFILYQGNWYWTRADGKARDLYGGSPFYLSYDDTLWNPDWQTLDVVKPVSSLAPLPSLSPYPILVRWSGSDSGGSGLRHYDIQVMVGNSGVWEDWLMGTWESSADYLGIPGETYAFRIRAQDQVLNTEDWPAGAEVVTTIETLAPETAVDPLPPFIRSSNGVYVSWGGIDPGGTGIQSYDVQLRVGNDSWLDWYVATDRTGDTVYENSINVGDTIYFRSRAVDGAGNQEEWPAGDGDTFTTLYRWGIRGTGHDNAGTPISGVQANIEPSTFRHIADTPAGNYAAYSIDSSAPYTVTWSRPGLGNLPPTAFGPDVDATKDVYLPPANNLWANGDFEAGPSTLRSGPPIITSTNAHTGQYALLMGTTAFFTPLQQISNGTWSGAATLYRTGGDFYLASPILAARGGRVYATWNIYETKTYTTKIMLTQKISTNDWSTPVFVAPEMFQSRTPSLLLDARDMLHLIWRNGLDFSEVPSQVYYPSQELVEATADIRYEQTMTLPVTMANPVLSYMYRLQNSLATDGVGLFVDVTDGNGTTTVAAYTADTGEWVHDWVDMSNWAGETVTIAFRLHEKAGLPLPQVYLDDVSLGSAQPDVWLTAVADGAASGQIATFTLVYGNRSGIAAPATRLTLTLPPEISYREASLTPVSLNPLVWELGMLAGESGPFTLRVTGEVAPEAVPLTTVAALAEIATAGELELLNNQVTLAVFLGKHSYLPMILKQ